jgi:hypothetical protein
MSESHIDPAKSEKPATEPIAYPTNHLVAIIDTVDQLRSAMSALTRGGFLESELTVSAGEGIADALSATTGRSGWADLAMRFTEKLGLPNDETLIKRQYEEALRDGHYVVAVLAESDDRKDHGAEILAANGGHFIHYLGRFAIQVMRP